MACASYAKRMPSPCFQETFRQGMSPSAMNTLPLGGPAVMVAQVPVGNPDAPPGPRDAALRHRRFALRDLQRAVNGVIKTPGAAKVPRALEDRKPQNQARPLPPGERMVLPICCALAVHFTRKLNSSNNAQVFATSFKHHNMTNTERRTQVTPRPIAFRRDSPNANMRRTQRRAGRRYCQSQTSAPRNDRATNPLACNLATLAFFRRRWSWTVLRSQFAVVERESA